MLSRTIELDGYLQLLTDYNINMRIYFCKAKFTNG